MKVKQCGTVIRQSAFQAYPCAFIQFFLMFNRAHILETYMVPLLTVRVFTSNAFFFHDTDLLQIPQGYFLCLLA